MEVNNILIDCAELSVRESAHDYIAEKFSFPSYYGKNLDALYDCLQELPPCTVILRNFDLAKDYAPFILGVLYEVACERESLKITYEQ